MRIDHKSVYHLLIQFRRSGVSCCLIHIVRIPFEEVVRYYLLLWDLRVIYLFQFRRHTHLLLDHHMSHWLSHLLLILVECDIYLLQSREIIDLGHCIMLLNYMLSNGSLRHRAGAHCLKFLAVVSHYLLVLRIVFRSFCDWSKLMLMVKLMLQVFHLEWALKRFHMPVLRWDQHIIVYVIWRYCSSSILLIWLNTYLWLVIS